MAKFDYWADLYNRFTSRKFLAFIAIIGLLMADTFGYIPLDDSTRALLVITALAYIGVEGGVDMIKN